MYFKKKVSRVFAIFCVVLLLAANATTIFANVQNTDNKDNESISSNTIVNSTSMNNDSEKSYLIGLKDNVDQDKFLEKKSLNKKAHKKFKMSKVIVAKLSPNEVQNLKNDKDISFVEADSIVQIASIGSVIKDHTSVKQMKKDSQAIPWGIHAIGAELSLENNDEGNNINIAVLDTGYADHPDLKVKGGISFVENTTDYSDDNGHGTHVIGTISAANNKIGVVGVAPKSDVYAVKVLDRNGSGTYSQIIEGIEWTIDNNIDIINMSFGGTENSQALHNTIIAASNKGILFIAAAGNNGAGAETELYPARYSEVISVGAIDLTNQIAAYSSTGSEIDLVAPGSEILSTTSDGGYGVMSGTSMATPHITGAAAVLWSKDKNWSSEQIKEKLYQTATPLGAENTYGHGLVNVAKALGLTDSSITPVPLPTATPNPPDNPTKPDLAFDIVKMDVQFAEYKSKLRNLFEMANNNGNTMLAKSIEEKLNGLIIAENKMRALPDNLSTVSNNKEMAAEAQVQINSYYSTKSEDFMALEYDYQKAIDEYVSKVTSVTNEVYKQSENTQMQSESVSSSNNEVEKPVTQTVNRQHSPSASGAAIKVKRDDSTQRGSVSGSVYDSTQQGSVSDNVYANSDSPTIQSTPSLTIVSTTLTSVTFSVTFPTSGIWGNVITVDDFTGACPVYSNTYDDNWYKQNGTYTISGLSPGGFYHIWMWWSTDGQWAGGQNSIYRKVQLPYSTSENLTQTDGTYVFANIESNDKNQASSTNFTRWLGHLDAAYTALNELVGRVPYSGGKIELKSTRTNINNNPDGGNVWWVTTALAGNPALFWQPFMKSQMMRLSTDDWGDAAIHELSHDFDNYSWEFDSEFFADFKEYYVVENLGAKVYRFDTNKYYTGAQFATFFKTDQWLSYDNTFAYGNYSSRGLVSIFIRIKNTIGWQPFKDTFRYFNNLSSSQIPSSNMDKFNLFMGKLSEYANYDVRSILTSSEISILQNWFGGTIAQNYNAQLVSETIPAQMVTGNSYTVSITVRNTGLNTWSESKSYRLGAIGDSDPFGGSRHYLSSGDSIAFNQTKTFTFTMTAPATPGTYTTDWQMVRDAYCWFGNTLVSKQVSVTSVPPIQSIYLNSPVDVDLATGISKIFQFTPSSSGTYAIFTGPYAGTGNSNDTYLELYTDQNLTNRIAYDDDSAGNFFSKISTTLTGGTKYYIKLRPYSSIAVHARLTVNIEVPPPQIIYLNSPVDVDLATGISKIFQFTPSSSGTFDIFTGPYGGTGNSNDTYLELYTDSGLTNKIAYNNDSAGNLFSIIKTPLTGGTTYYIKLRPYSSSIAVHARLTVTKKIIIKTLYLDTPIDTQVAEGDYNVFRFTPSENGLYKFYTGPYAGTGGSSDTYLELYTDQNLTNMIAYDDDSAGKLFSLLQCELQANTSYYLKFRGYADRSANARLTVNRINKIPLTWPTTSNQITLRFGQIDNFYNAIHTGIDIQGNTGSNIVSALNGQVVYAGNNGDYGNIVYINADYYGKKIQTRYAHLQDYSVTTGLLVNANTVIGRLGNTGKTSGAHLHFEVLESTDGNACKIDDSNTVRKDPLLYLSPIRINDSSYLSNPFAIGKVPGDTFDFLTTKSNSLNSVTNSVYSDDISDSVNTTNILDFSNLYYMQNEDSYGNKLKYEKAYLRHLVEAFAYSREGVTNIDLESEGILTWDNDLKLAKVNLNSRTKYYSIYISNATDMNNRLVVNRFDFYDYFYGTGFPSGYADFSSLSSYKTRSQWGANPVNESVGIESVDNPQEYYDTVVIHHSERSQYEDIKDLQTYFQNDKKFPDIGYHFVIGADGTVFEGMPINIKGWHVEQNNSHKIGIVMLGNFHNGTGAEGNLHDVINWVKNEGYTKPTNEQIESLRQLIKILYSIYGIDYVGGHKDFALPQYPTNCPGNIAYPILQNEAIIN